MTLLVDPPFPHEFCTLGRRAASALLAALLAVFFIGTSPAQAQTLPEIRMSPSNQVPSCVTPDRLMAFLKSRNSRLLPRFRSIADWYQLHGERWQVRWDYAFYQMALETNFLTFRQGNGRMGDVDPAQNNFAGLGTTGGGVPGDSFPDVSSGVLGQIQHLVVYSGERLDEPTAPRTRLKQEEILKKSWQLSRSVRFSDLAGRWAVDPKYGRSIAWVAASFNKRFCPEQPALRQTQANSQRQSADAKPSPARRSVVRTIWRRGDPHPGSETSKEVHAQNQTGKQLQRPAHLAAGVHCTYSEASYGGTRTVLLRTASAEAVRFVALSVLDGFEASMTDNFVKQRMPGAKVLGTYPNKSKALQTAHDLCPQ